MNVQRPLDALNAAKGKRVFVELKNGTSYVGELQAFDIHINLVLDNTEEQNEGKKIRRLGRVLIRGDNVLIVSPEVGA